MAAQLRSKVSEIADTIADIVYTQYPKPHDGRSMAILATRCESSARAMRVNIFYNNGRVEMIIPETRWNHGVTLAVGIAGGAVSVISSGRKIHTIVVVRWPWASPIVFLDQINGVNTKTRFLFQDLRDKPLNLEQVAVNGKTCEDFLPETA